jgi:hypothetical protein
MKELKKIDESLELLHNDFNKQLEALGSDTKEFHNALIDLSAKYPDHKELLQFIVFINDKLETNQSMFADIVVESFNELIRTKKTLVQKLLDEKENITKVSNDLSIWQKVKVATGAMKNIKMILTSIAVILLAVGVIIAPDMFIEIIKELAKLL